MVALPDRLPPGVAEKLGAYVYALRDPRTKRIFYIGKGNGERVFQHVWSARGKAASADAGEVSEIESHDGARVTAAKESRINEIYDSGHAVEHLILRHAIEPGANADREAFIVEQVLIRAFREHEHGHDLTNLVEGHSDTEYATFPISELIARYAAKPLPRALPTPCGIVVINRAWNWLLTDEEAQEKADPKDGSPTDEQIYKASREYWKVGEGTREIADLPIFVLAGKVIRAVYHAKAWHKKPYSRGHKQAWAFDGARAEDMADFVGCALQPSDVGYAGWRQHGWHPITSARQMSISSPPESDDR